MDILIVDDSVALRKILQRVIRNAGVPVNEIREAGDGEHALQSLETFRPDVILSDINMPVMDGLQLLARIKKHRIWQSLPVIMISTEASREKVLEAIELGASGFIRKPFSENEIREKLCRT